MLTSPSFSWKKTHKTSTKSPPSYPQTKKSNTSSSFYNQSKSIPSGTSFSPTKSNKNHSSQKKKISENSKKSAKRIKKVITYSYAMNKGKIRQK